jgi:hypothetical protein
MQTRAVFFAQTIACCFIMAACSDYNSITADESGPAITLDASTPSQSFKVRVCYDGSDADELDVTISVNSTGAGTLSLEDGSQETALTADDEAVVELDLAGLGGSFDAACETGVVVVFASPEASMDAIELEWSANATATQVLGDEILRDSLSIEFEPL